MLCLPVPHEIKLPLSFLVPVYWVLSCTQVGFSAYFLQIERCPRDEPNCRRRRAWRGSRSAARARRAMRHLFVCGQLCYPMQQCMSYHVYSLVYFGRPLPTREAPYSNTHGGSRQDPPLLIDPRVTPACRYMHAIGYTNSTSTG